MTDPSPQSRAIELEVEVPGTPEEVWQAVATGPGITSWFIPMQVEERTGGEVTMDWGSVGSETADVVVWEPPHRVVFRGRGEQALAYEWLVEAKDAGSCIVRLVNSGFGDGDDWDEQLHGMSEGWRIFMENLRLQRTSFPGREARAVIATVTVAGPGDRAWGELCAALGIPADASKGDVVSTRHPAPSMSGRIETVMASPAARAYLLLLDEPHPGTAFVAVEGDGDQVAGSAYLYLYDRDGVPVDDAIGSRWMSWLSERFPPVTG
ncbi:MAG: SRPBCC domain-containing protein [Acidimicrobiales bacterium]